MKKLSYLALGLSLALTTTYGATPGTIQWTYNVQGATIYTPAVVADGTIYAPSGGQYLWALNPNGTKKWATYIPYPITGSPAIATDGSIFVSTNTTTQSLLYKILSTGIIAWATAPQNLPTPAGCAPGTVYFHLMSAPAIVNNVVSFANWVETSWVSSSYSCGYGIRTNQYLSYLDQNTGQPIYQSLGVITQDISPNPVGTVPLSWLRVPYVDAARNIEVSTSNNFDSNLNISLPALLITKNLIGIVNNPSPPVASNNQLISPVGGGNGVLYVGDTGGNLFKYDESGNLLQPIHLHGDISKSAPVVAPNGVVYVGSDDGSLYAINPDGTLEWHTFVDSAGLDKSAALNTDGVVYVTSADGQVYALNPQGQLLWKQPVDAQALTAPAVGPDGTLYVGDSSGDIVAINGEPLSGR